MVFLFILFFFISSYLFFSSFHLLISLLYLEGLAVMVIFMMSFLSLSWFTFLMVILVTVCAGAYGVCVLISMSRSKGVDYFMFF